ncbi:MAG: hypothetical protein GXY36_13345 [Chloroflexi bacterium]|nr:hypothetical protein [Chloroflexota bacterium]
MNGLFKGRGRHYFSLLACPVDGGGLKSAGEAAVCTQDGAHRYPFEDGILRLATPEQRSALDARSAALEVDLAAQGWQSPDEAAFKALPQTALSGYPAGYWMQQAAGTALLWRFLEMVRLQNGGLPVGPAGEAAVIGAEMGWLAYGLDVAGYTTLAIDAYTGPRYGLAVFPIARYLRVQADPIAPPLARAALDVLVYQNGLARSGPDADQDRALAHGLRALRPGGWIAVMDPLNTSVEAVEALRARLGAAGLLLLDAPQQRGWRARFSDLVGRLSSNDPLPPPVTFAQKPG